MYHRRIHPIWAADSQWMDSVPMGLGGTQNVEARGPRYSIAFNELVTALRGSPPPAPIDKRTSMHVPHKEAAMEIGGTCPRFPLCQIKEAQGLQPCHIG